MEKVTSLSHVALSDIQLSATNKIFRDPGDLDVKGSLAELIESIKKQGVISPVLLRTNGKPGKFELVAGERRYRASAAAGLTSIPAYIRTLSDEEALDLQLTENLQRKDIHPLKEARGYKYLIERDAKKNTTAELALRFGKSETYVLQRLKLNDLVAEAVKDFESGAMSLSHASMIARLQPADQKEVIRHCSRSHQKVNYYETVHELQDFIDQSVICSLDAAPFNKTDAKLLPRAGACVLCPKRSGANQLFSDLKEKDRCFDRACYNQKKAMHMVTHVKELIEKKPDIVFLLEAGRGAEKEVHPEIKKILADHKITPLVEYQDFYEYNSDRYTPMKGYYLNGDNAGKEKTVYNPKKSTQKATASGGVEKVNVAEAVAGIKNRTKRAAELDGEKVYERVIAAMAKYNGTPANKIARQKAEVAALFQIVYNYSDYQVREKLNRVLKVGRLGSGKKNAERLKSLSEREQTFMVRQVMVNQWSSPMMVRSSEGHLVMEAAQAWGVPVKQFQADQHKIALKREVRAAERIRELKAESKPKKVTKGKEVTP